MLRWRQRIRGWCVTEFGVSGEKRMFRKALFAAFAVFIVFAGEARAASLELTPGNMFGLWSSINKALIAAAELSGGEALAGSMEAEKPSSFSGKNSADVLARTVEFHEKLNRLIARGDGAPAKALLKTDGNGVTPGLVYLNSGIVLDSLVLHVYSLDIDQVIGGYYVTSDVPDKSHNDVFSLADLANRRIDLLIGAL